MDQNLAVLLVDDDEDEYVLLKSMFARLPGLGSMHRYQLDWVPDYERALEACARQQYDVYLVDYHLGQYNGLNLIRAAAELGISAPFILLTGQGSYELDLAAMEQGVADYLLKDQVNEYLLERSIRYALERKQAQAELEDRVRERTRELAQANQALRISEDRFRTLADTTSAAIFIVQDHFIRYANPAARFVTGYPVDQLVGMELWKLAHPSYQAQLREERLVTHWSENVPARYEIKIITPQGDERWVDMTAGTMEFENRPAWLITAFDITERDLAEQALRKTRDELEQRVIERTAQIEATSTRLQTVLRTLPVAITIADDTGWIVERNESFQELWGLHDDVPQQIEDWQSFQAWWSEDGSPLAGKDWPLVRAVQRGESVVAAMIDILTLDGQRKTILNSAVPIFDLAGGLAGGVSVAQDISAQRALEQQAKAAAREAQQRADELDGLHRATAALLSTLDLDELLSQILDAAQSAIPAAERGMLHLLSPSTGRLEARATLGLSNERITIIHSPNSQEYPAQVVRERRPIRVLDTHAEGMPEGVSENMRDARALIIAPLHIGEQVLGALSLSSSRPAAFTESNLRLLVSFAATTTAALQNAILHAEVKRLAILDPLTGLYNRRAFFDLGQREVERFLRFNHPLSALMMDLDKFKEVNDTLGHAAGDQVLRALASRVRESIRETDIFGRYGGDEFALLLPDTDLDAAMHIAGRIQAAFSALPWITEQGVVPVAASLGVAGAGKQHRLLEELLADADKALYRAKAAGRSRVEVFSTD